MNELIRSIVRRLPRVAEEGLDQESVLESQITEAIVSCSDGKAGAAQVIGVVRQLLRAASCLDERELLAGRWRFVSFPAYLFARSLLESLSTDSPSVLEGAFWDAAPTRVEAQRRALRFFEEARLGVSSAAQPIRRVWVSWAPIAVDGKFLLVRREDRQPLRIGSKGEFVLPGGRLAPGDLSQNSLHERLRFFDPYADVADLSDVEGALERALRRELSEELGLDGGAIATVFPYCGRIAHTALEGANSAHAITEYLIQVFAVRLESAGKSRLLRRLAATPDQFAWFSPGELMRQRNGEGQTSYIDALIALPEPDRNRILDLEACEVSIGSSTVRVADQLKVDVPIASNLAMTVGRTGRERHIAHGLDDGDCALLAFFAAVRRGHRVSDLHPLIKCVPYLGWVVIDDQDLLQRLRALSVRLTKALGRTSEWAPMDFEGTAVRLNVARQEDAFFAPEAFALVIHDEVPGKSFRIRLERRAIRSVLGTVDLASAEQVVPYILGTTLAELAQGSTSFAQKNLDTWKRDQRTIQIKEDLGLKLLVREVDGKPTLCVSEARVVQNRSSGNSAGTDVENR